MQYYTQATRGDDVYSIFYKEIVAFMWADICNQDTRESKCSSGAELYLVVSSLLGTS